jgi:hypothetical protein
MPRLSRSWHLMINDHVALFNFTATRSRPAFTAPTCPEKRRLQVDRTHLSPGLDRCHHWHSHHNAYVKTGHRRDQHVVYLHRFTLVAFNAAVRVRRWRRMRPWDKLDPTPPPTRQPHVPAGRQGLEWRWPGWDRGGLQGLPRDQLETVQQVLGQPDAHVRVRQLRSLLAGRRRRERHWAVRDWGACREGHELSWKVMYGIQCGQSVSHCRFRQ